MHRTMNLQRFDGVNGTGRVESTMLTKKRTQKVTVGFDGRDHDPAKQIVDHSLFRLCPGAAATVKRLACENVRRAGPR